MTPVFSKILKILGILLGLLVGILATLNLEIDNKVFSLMPCCRTYMSRTFAF